MDINTRALTGFMELLPSGQLEFNRIKAIIDADYQRFGFTPLDTPLIERSEVLLAKAGGEIKKQIYDIKREKGLQSLRFDLTVPLARYVAEHFADLNFPFRRSHIGKVFRGERPQKGRFREFYQCDIDVIGNESLDIAYDAEIPTVIYSIFKKLDFGKFTIKVNNRKILSGLMDHINASQASQEVLRAIDKIEKITRAELTDELVEIGLNNAQIQTLFDFVAISGESDMAIKSLRKLGIENETFLEGVNELETVTTLMKSMGIEKDYFTVDLSIARGLDYYTGTIYETTLDEYPGIGSVCSGGRYDDLASHYIDRKLPGVGISIGLTRLFYQLSELGLINTTKKTSAEALVIPLGNEMVTVALESAQKMRDAGINTDVLLADIPIKKRFRYADGIGVPFAVVIGEEEARTNKLLLQDMTTGEKKQLTTQELIEHFTERK